MKYAIIAGNGRFPILALENARKLGHEVVAVGIKEEASTEIEAFASKCHWISLGQLSKLIEILQRVRDFVYAFLEGRILTRYYGDEFPPRKRKLCQHGRRIERIINGLLRRAENMGRTIVT